VGTRHPGEPPRGRRRVRDPRAG